MLQLDYIRVLQETQSRTAQFLNTLAAAETRALLLDYDGTLAPFSNNPKNAFPYPGMAHLLQHLQTAARTRVVIISGRNPHDVHRLLGLDRLEVWGSHGAERLLPDGRYQHIPLSDKEFKTLNDLALELLHVGLGDFMERKSFSIALHWRGREADAGEIARKALECWFALPQPRSIRVQRFDGGIELNASPAGKGHAVKTLLTELDSGAAVAYLGDDLTDEDAFAALAGRGLSILVRETLRPTRAEVWLQPPHEMTAFLQAWANACGGAV